MNKIAFIVYGDARPASFSFGRGMSKSGKPFMWKSTKHADWMKSIRVQALEHKPDELILGAVALSLVFWRRKPSSAGKDWRKAKTPERAAKAAYPISKPDLTSLERPIEDALSGLFYRDDSQIVMKQSIKLYAEEDEQEKVGIVVEALEPERDRDALWVADFIKQELQESEPQLQEGLWDAPAEASSQER